MKRLAFLILFLIFSLNQFAQVYLHPQGMAYYKEGNAMMEKGEYREAEKSLTIALNTLKNENVYIKRGIARLNQYDTIGFCQDMNMAANKYFNLQASLLFNDVCCKSVDTLYFLKNMQPSSKVDFRYFEEIKVPKYDDKTIGIIHDIKVKKEKFNTEYGRDKSNLGKNFLPPDKTATGTYGTTDIIAAYEKKDTAKYYLICTNPPYIQNLTKYNFVKNSMKKQVKINYYNLKVEKNVELTIYFELYVNSQGEITRVQVIGTYPEIEYSEFEKELEEDITNIVKQYPPIKPATFQGNKVNFIALDYVTY